MSSDGSRHLSFGYWRVVGRDGKWHRLHRACWEAYNGPIPKTWVVHHIDGNRQNNAIANLQCMLHGDHTRLHAGGVQDHVRRELHWMLEQVIGASEGESVGFALSRKPDKTFVLEVHREISEYRERAYWSNLHDVVFYAKAEVPQSD